MSRICIAHLVRRKNGIAPFAQFIDSYRDHPAGIEHDLLLIFKGFIPNNRELGKYHSLLKGIPYRSLFLADHGFDIEPYFTAARMFEYDYLCFLNSFSVILDRGWLAKMHRHVADEEVGVVGATGSYESHYSSRLYLYKNRFNIPLYLWKKYRQPRLLPRFKANYDPFPNYHIRTNAFLIARNIMLKLEIGPMRNKWDALYFESGKKGMTRQIFEMNLKPLIVGRDGEAYEKERWYESFTFRNGEQHNLLVADKQTAHYLTSDAFGKTWLSKAAWGERFIDVPCNRKSEMNHVRYRWDNQH